MAIGSTIVDEVITDFNDVLDTYGVQVSFHFFTGSGISATDYDYPNAAPPSAWLQSGNAVSGALIHFPLRGNTAGEDFKFMEQGILRYDDRKIFFAGSIYTEMPTNGKLRIQIGTKRWELLGEGIRGYMLGSTNVYYEGYIREFVSGT